MPGLLNSGAVPALVAYAKVKADGSSPDLNSGITTENTGPGAYRITLPASLAQPNLGSRDLIMLTPWVENGGFSGLSSLNYFWSSETTIEIGSFTEGGEGPGQVNQPFDFMLWRSTISPPLDAPA